MEFQDAETLGKGRSSFGGASSTGFSFVELYKDSSRAFGSKTSSWQILEPNYQVAIEEDFDIGFSLWNTSILTSFFRIPQEDNNHFDLGAKVNLKKRLTKKDSERNFAIELTVVGHPAYHEKEGTNWHYYAAGIAPGIIYSRNISKAIEQDKYAQRKFLFSQLRSLYAGMKVYFFMTDIKYQFPVSSNNKAEIGYPVIFNPFIGASFGKDIRHYIEFSGSFMKNPYSGIVNFMPSIGMGTKFYF